MTIHDRVQDRQTSWEIYEKSCRLMPGGVSSPVRSFSHLGVLPLVIERGEGSSFFDSDGHAYLDYCGSWGALILGHAHPDVVDVACEQVRQGSSFGTITPYELLLAEAIQEALPHLEKIRFVSSGTEAVMSALRLARGFTGKNKIIKFNGHYHGHCDSLLVQAGSGVSYLKKASSAGIPEEMLSCTVSLPFNDEEAFIAFLRAHDDIAAVILEPVAGNMGVVPADPAFLLRVRQETAHRGILLIFDEVITGFRVGRLGAAGLYGICPDLTCLGKIIGGGFPAAAFGGRGEIMNHLAPLGSVYQAGTLSGNPVAMRAGHCVLNILKQPQFYADLQAKADRLLDPIIEYLPTLSFPVTLHRVGSMFTLFLGVDQVRSFEDVAGLDRDLFSRFFTSLLASGIYLSPSPFETSFVSYAHTDQQLDDTADAIISSLKEIL